ncbi:uncharacterized protein HGUI_03989 [Hanseniaspora guilliermondii]|uniref:PA14 domain-containing protein n=1 Tax=Hanseniaspora guilliermondii TaxID=56406 RepID=A0A1L0B7I0_9ASCO|nr:uncharacterized protein HGUI_03989 [Hanseniaspora guilliermondii]
MKSALNILFTFILLQTANAVGQQSFDSKIGCQIDNNMQFESGLSGSVYYYPWLSYNTGTKKGRQDSSLYTTEAYLSGGYIGDGSIITQDHTVYTKPGVIATDVTATELYFRNDSPCDANGCEGEVWLDLDYFSNADGTAVSVPFKQFAFHMNGYIIPNITGQYIINLNYIDDLAIINIGSNGFKSPNCCGNYSPTGDVSGNNTIQSIWTSNGPSGINEAVLQLVAGVAYPIEIFYVNRGAAGALQLEYIDPNGDSHKTFEGFIYHLSSEAVCNYVEKHVSTIEWDQSSTSYSSTSDTSILTETNSYLSDAAVTFTGTLVQETDIVYVPVPTVSTYWTGSNTFTTTSYSTTTDTDGNPVTKSIIYVKTPESTTTELWTGSYTYTTSSSAVIINSMGSTVTSPIVVVKTPESTITKPWTGTATTTVTSDVVVTGTDGKPTTETVIVVETPESTITVPWTGSITSTTTSSTVVTGTDGKPTTETVIVVETPESTITKPWTGSVISTTTSYTVVNGTDGNPTSSPIVVVETPESTITVPWTGSITSTTTSSTVVTGTDGKPTTETVIVVETPDSTITKPWTGTATTTITSDVVVTGEDNKETTSTVIVVETPESTITVPWTGSITSTTTSSTVVTGTDGKPTTETVIVVETPASIITKPWTGSITSTTTSSTVVTGTDGKPTTETVIVVETPASTITKIGRAHV